MSYKKKFKDSDPCLTIEYIFNILEKLNIKCEENWLESIPGIYSLQVKVCKSNLFSNGKGATIEYARASAYAELLERLQNFLPFRLSTSYISNYVSSRKLQNSDVYIDLNTNSLKWAKLVFKEKYNDFLEVLNMYSSELICSNFTKIDDDSALLIPYFCLDYYYGSNGMAAGNTYEEAIVQAISEVFERHIIGECIKDNQMYKYPVLNNILVNTNDDIKNKILNFEENGITVKVLDVSKGKYPVLATVFIEKSTNSYFVNGASHPNAYIATERTFTEFLQGRKIGELSDLSLIGFHAHNINLEENRQSIFYDGSGEYPICFFDFTNEASALDSLWCNEENNKDMLSYLISLLGDNLTVYVNKCGFLGLPTVQVIIPGLSEVAPCHEFKGFKKVLQRKYISLNFDKLVHSIDGINRIIDFLVDNSISETSSLREIFNLSGSSEDCDEFDNINKILLLAMLNLIKEDYNETINQLLKYIAFLSNQKVENRVISYYQKILFVLKFLDNGYNICEIRIVLESMEWTMEDIEEIIYDLSKTMSSLPSFDKISFDMLSKSEQNDYNILVKLLN